MELNNPFLSPCLSLQKCVACSESWVLFSGASAAWLCFALYNQTNTSQGTFITVVSVTSWFVEHAYTSLETQIVLVHTKPVGLLFSLPANKTLCSSETLELILLDTVQIKYRDSLQCWRCSCINNNNVVEKLSSKLEIFFFFWEWAAEK